MIFAKLPLILQIAFSVNLIVLWGVSSWFALQVIKARKDMKAKHYFFGIIASLAYLVCFGCLALTLFR